MASLEQQLKNIQKEITKNVEGKKSFSELFNHQFMKKYTECETIDKLFEKGEIVINSQEEFDNLPEEKMDSMVKQYTKFNTWKDMLGQAAEEYTINELKKQGFKFE